MSNKNIDYMQKKWNSSLDKYEVVGLFCMMILSKDLFRNNINASEFVLKTLDYDCPNYIKKSRTLMIAKVVRLISSFEEKELCSLKSKCHNFYNELTDELKNEVIPDKTINKKKNENDKLSTWLNGLKYDK